MGTLVLGGWFLHMPVLTHVLPGPTSMKVNTAVGVLAAGLALLWLHMCAAASVRFRLARVLAEPMRLGGAGRINRPGTLPQPHCRLRRRT
jgi:hypothetical protein